LFHGELPGKPGQGNLFGTAIRVKWVDNEPLFVAKDVCDALEITQYRHAVKRLYDDETCVVVVHTNRGPREMAAVTESGLYHLIFMSRKPVAQAFRKWVSSEVLPAIRLQGFYANPESRMRVRDYLAAREIDCSVHGFGFSCASVCKRAGIAPNMQRGRGHAYPVHILEKVALRKDAKRPPLAGSGKGVLEFIFSATDGNR